MTLNPLIIRCTRWRGRFVLGVLLIFSTSSGIGYPDTHQKKSVKVTAVCSIRNSSEVNRTCLADSLKKAVNKSRARGPVKAQEDPPVKRNRSKYLKSKTRSAPVSSRRTNRSVQRRYLEHRQEREYLKSRQRYVIPTRDL